MAGEVKFVFKQVQIIDVNRNDRLDVGVDEVVTVEGKALTHAEQSRRLQQLLNELQVNSWQGLSLDAVSVYLQALHAARDFSQKGFVNGLEGELAKARNAALSSVFIYDQQLGQRLLKRALINGVDYRLKDAVEESLLQGNMRIVTMDLKFAEGFAKRLQQEFNYNHPLNQAQLDATLKQAYEQGVPVRANLARKKAALGDIETTKMYLSDVEFFQAEAVQQFNIHPGPTAAEVSAIKKQAYELGIPIEYDKMREDAAEGNLFIARIRSNRLQAYIQEANQEFNLNTTFDSDRAETEIRTGVLERITTLFGLAEDAAKLQDVATVDIHLNGAHAYISEYNNGHIASVQFPRLSFDAAKADALRLCALGRASCP